MARIPVKMYIHLLVNCIYACSVSLFIFPESTIAVSPDDRPAILGIAHVALRCSNLNQAQAYYGQILGLEEIQIDAAGNGSKPNTFFRINERQHLELIADLQGDEDRLDHFGLETLDVEKMCTYLAKSSIAMPERTQRDQDEQNFIRFPDPEGHMIEFVQRAQSHSNTATVIDRRISKRILHIGITVRDTSAMNRFYQEILGLLEFWRGGTHDSITSWINYRIPESTDYIEYMLVAAEPTPKQLFSAHHVSLMVPDMQDALDRLWPRWDGYMRGTLRIGRNNRWILNMYDPDGTRIELMEPHTVR